MEKINNTNRVKLSKTICVFIFFLFIIFIVRLCYLCLCDQKVGSSTLSNFIQNRNTLEEELLPERGSIYDVNGNILAQNVSSYTVIAYLDEKRSENSETIRHVQDIDMTAQVLSSYLNMDVEYLKLLLSKDNYQVELGPGGRNLTQIQMEEIKALNLPGIDFVKSTKRYYPYGDFASYLLGYTVSKDEQGVLTGELGIEECYNDELTGENGYVTYEKDRYGYRIANGREYREDAINGSSIYLTIDSNIQLFVENALKKASNDSESEWAFMVVANAKTGEILGYSSTPSYDPNQRNMVSYLDLIVNNTYEPGSTMKIFSYMCAIEKGTYVGSDTYLSGSKTFKSTASLDDEVTIKDWNNTGWGEITYDKGFALSSNIAVANILENYITKKELRECYEKYGFGKKTGITLPREAKGDIDFTYDVEAATAAFGQGITITPIQMIEALTSLANDGDLLKPYIVKKIVDSKTGKNIYEGERQVLRNVASKETVSKMTELLKSVINPDPSLATGYNYYMDGYNLMGKTGTAQIYYSDNGGYKTGTSDNIFSFAGLYPSDNPEIIIYMGMKKPKDTGTYLPDAVKSVIVNVSKYLNLNKNENSATKYNVENYSNKTLSPVLTKLTGQNLNVVVLGDGDKIIDQYPQKGVTVFAGDLIILKTNNYNKKMINLYGMSYKEVVNALNLMGVNYNINGKGYVTSQSIAEGVIVSSEDVVNVDLNSRYN